MAETDPSKDLDFDFERASQAPAGDFLAASHVREAILRHLANGAIDLAASLIASSGTDVGDALVDEDMKGATPALAEALAEAFFRARDFDRAGRAASLLEDPARAGVLFEKAGQHARAAALFEKALMPEKAAEMYERAGKHDRAAKLFLQISKVDRAASAFEKGGRHYEAGRLWTRQKRLDRALEALQKVDEQSENFVPAMHLLGRILEFTGHKEAAQARYQAVVKSKPLDGSTVEIYERLIELYVAQKRDKEARSLIAAVMRAQPQRPYAHQALMKLLGNVNPEQTLQSPGVSRTTQPPASGQQTRAEQSPSGSTVTITAVHATVDTLRKLPLLSELSLDEIRQLHNLGEKFSAAPGDVLLSEGSEASHFFVVLAGSVEVRVKSNGADVLLAELRYGACVGEIALLDGGPASASVVVTAPVNAFRWPIEALRQHIEQNEHVAACMLRVLGRTMAVRLRESNRLAALAR